MFIKIFSSNSNSLHFYRIVVPQRFCCRLGRALHIQADTDVSKERKLISISKCGVTSQKRAIFSRFVVYLFRGMGLYYSYALLFQLLITGMGLLSKNVAYIRSTARNSSWSILQLLISCKSFLPRLSEQNKKDSERPTYRERRQEDCYRSPNHRLPWNGIWQEKRWALRSVTREKREKRFWWAGVCFRATCIVRSITQDSITRSLSTELTRHSLVLRKIYKESSDSTFSSEIPPSFICITLFNLSIASKQMKKDEMLKA